MKPLVILSVCLFSACGSDDNFEKRKAIVQEQTEINWKVSGYINAEMATGQHGKFKRKIDSLHIIYDYLTAKYNMLLREAK